MWISWKGVNHKYQGINYNPLNPVHFPQIHELEELEQQLVASLCESQASKRFQAFPLLVSPRKLNILLSKTRSREKKQTIPSLGKNKTVQYITLPMLVSEPIEEDPVSATEGISDSSPGSAEFPRHDWKEEYMDKKQIEKLNRQSRFEFCRQQIDYKLFAVIPSDEASGA